MNDDDNDEAPFPLVDVMEDPAKLATLAPEQLPELLQLVDFCESRLRLVRALLHQRMAAPGSAADEPGGMTGSDDDLLTDTQVAQLLAIPVSTVADLRRAGVLPGVPVGRKYIRTRRGDVRAYVTALPHVTYSRRHDRRGGAGPATTTRLDTATTR